MDATKTKAVFGGYDKPALDAQYDNRSRHPEHKALHAAWSAEGDKVLAEFDCRLDIPFGPSPDEVLDIYLPKKPKAAPVNVFLHGGYWMSRHKNDFRFIARGVVPAGAISVIVNYALVPAVTPDEQVRQCRAALAWTWANARSVGGDPDRVFVSGHSAGGHLAAMTMATDWPRFGGGLPPDLIKGATALSGIYDLEPIRHTFMQATLGFTRDQAARLSPARLAPATRAPLIVAVGGGETAEFLRHADELAAAWKGKVSALTKMVRPGINHFTILGEFADPTNPLARATLKQMSLD
jgi:arylformamidase